jgi:hypothetical protein
LTEHRGMTDFDAIEPSCASACASTAITRCKDERGRCASSCCGPVRTLADIR